MDNYDFPVSLQTLHLPNGTPIEGHKAVVRTDTGAQLSVVSNKYKLVTYDRLLHEADKFAAFFGTPKKEIFVERGGKALAAAYTYQEPKNTVGIAVDDLVGLRLYVKNSYTPGQSIQCRVGTLRLRCLNGAVSHRGVFERTIRHTGNIPEIMFPNPAELFDSFQENAKFLQKLNTINLTDKEWGQYNEAAAEKGVIPEAAIAVTPPSDVGMPQTAWKLYNKFTYYVNHAERSSASQLGKVRRLGRINRFFELTF